MLKITNLSVQTILRCEEYLKLLRHNYLGTERPKELSSYFSIIQESFSGENISGTVKQQINLLQNFSANNINQLIFTVSLMKLFLVKGKVMSSMNFLQWLEKDFGFIIDFQPVSTLTNLLKEHLDFCNYTRSADLLKLTEHQAALMKVLSVLEIVENNPAHCKLFSYLNRVDQHEIYYLSGVIDSTLALETKNNPHIQIILHKEEPVDNTDSHRGKLMGKIASLKQTFVVTKMEDGSPVSMKNIKMMTSYYSQYLKIIFELSRSIPLNIVFVFPSMGIIKKMFSYQQTYLRSISVYKNIFFETQSYFENNRLIDILKSKSTKGNILFAGYHSPIREILCGNFVTVLCGLPTTDYNNINRHTVDVFLDWLSRDNVVAVDSFVMQDQMRRALPEEFIQKWNDKNVSLTVQKVVKIFDYGNVK